VAAADEELAGFVREALARGVPRDMIAQALGEAGWRPEQVRRALANWAEVTFPVPVPRPRPYLSARDAFLYLVLFTALYITAFNLGSLAFRFIERAFPDPAMRAGDTGFRHAVRWAVANLIVAFPLFVALSVSMQRAIDRDPTKRASRIRKWLTYLTLFIGAGVLIGDVIALVNGLLSGELTTRFVLKVLVVAAIAGTAFGYYLWDLRQDEREDTA
jgi:hypothetical protein